LPDRLSAWLDTAALAVRSHALLEQSAALKLRTRTMWDMVEQTLLAPAYYRERSVG
jgi:hypothetical protein